MANTIKSVVHYNNLQNPQLPQKALCNNKQAALTNPVYIHTTLHKNISQGVPGALAYRMQCRTA